MVGSLANRILILCGLLCAVLALLAGLLLFGSSQMRNSLEWVNHSSQVIRAAGWSLNHLQNAESSQRGFILARNADFASNIKAEITASQHEAAELVRRTGDNPMQNMRARQIKALVEERAAIVEKAVALGRAGDFTAAQEITASGRGRYVMLLVEARIRDFIGEERALSTQRMAAVNRRLDYIHWLILVGMPLTLLIIMAMGFALIRQIRRPMDAMMAVMESLGAGNRSARIDADMASSEFERLANGYNVMADELEAAVSDQVVSEERLKVANQELSHNAEILKERGEVIELLGGMAHRMQAARTDEELSSIIRVFVPRVLPDIPGALYAHNNSRNLLVPLAAWSGLTVDPAGFAPDQCWALRRGQSHFVVEPDSDIVCGHVVEKAHHYHCEPLLAGGEVIGVLYLRGVVGQEKRFRLTVLTENIASALVNHRLQRGLREQTIRDPLTALFNRRYMEETLALEIARASRTDSPLGLIMCDVDHFKRFNDEFGHAAGDIVLQSVAAEMRNRFREGDVVCRFGGEEFTIIAPDTSAAVLADRAETVRQAISELNISQGGRTLGPVTMSFGIACWEDHMERDGATFIKAADTALYRAKRAGRNRVAVAVQEMLVDA